MPKFNQDKINSIFLRMPDLRYLINQSFRKTTAICPFIIVRGTTNATEAGYQPQGAEPRDYTSFEQVIDGFDPIIVDWEDSVEFPFDGTLDQRYKQSPSIKVRGVKSLTEEKNKVSPLGSVFQYQDRTEFKLNRLWYDYWLEEWLDGIPAYSGDTKETDLYKRGRWETNEEYQARFKKELGKELDRLAEPENKKQDNWGREYYEQLHTKYLIKKHGTGKYFSAYFLSDEVSPVVKQWLGNEHFQRLSIQKQITVLVLNTTSKEIFQGYEAEGFEGNRGFFDRIDKYRLCLWRLPEFDLTYDLENATENEEKKRKGYRGSFLAVDRTWFRVERTSYIRNPANKEIIGALLTFGSVNDLLSRSGVAINTKIQQGGPGEPFAEPTLFEVSRRNEDGSYYINPRTKKKVLLGRVPVLDSQFTIPRPITSATITFHGLCAFNSVAFFGRRAENFNLARKGYEFVGPSGLIFPYQFHKTQWDPLTMKKPPETTYSVGSLHPMVQSYQKLSELWKNLQNPQKQMPNEGIFNLPVSTFFTSNEKALPFWDDNFLKNANWDWFMKSPPVDKAPNNPDPRISALLILSLSSVHIRILS